MSTWTEDDNLTDEQLAREGIRRGNLVTSRVINRIDPDEEYRKQQKKKREQERYEIAQKEAEVKFEIQQKLEKKRQEQDAKAYLLKMGWEKWGLPKPYQKFYTEGICDLCNSEVMYLASNSPHVKADDFPLNIPLDKSQRSGYNYEVRHICSEVSPQTIRRVMSMIHDLRKDMIERDAEIKNFARRASA